MGCIETKFTQCFKNIGKNKKAAAKSKQTIMKVDIQPRRGSTQQGVQELKKNYLIDQTTKKIGEGAFGNVFLTTN